MKNILFPKNTNSHTCSLFPQKIIFFKDNSFESDIVSPIETNIKTSHQKTKKERTEIERLKKAMQTDTADIEDVLFSNLQETIKRSYVYRMQKKDSLIMSCKQSI